MPGDGDSPIRTRAGGSARSASGSPASTSSAPATTVLERNYRTRRGEIDVIALGHGALVFCEVKTRLAGGRTGPAGPLDAIGDDEAPAPEDAGAGVAIGERLARARAETLRFDAIGITLSSAGALLALEHVEGAF